MGRAPPILAILSDWSREGEALSLRSPRFVDGKLVPAQPIVTRSADGVLGADESRHVRYARCVGTVATSRHVCSFSGRKRSLSRRPRPALGLKLTSRGDGLRASLEGRGSRRGRAREVVLDALAIGPMTPPDPCRRRRPVHGCGEGLRPRAERIASTVRQKARVEPPRAGGPWKGCAGAAVWGRPGERSAEAPVRCPDRPATATPPPTRVGDGARVPCD